jgi:hypothetical protein
MDSITSATTGMKHGVGRDAHIVLAPQPSEDPNDPLNWSSLRKELNLIVLGFGTILHGAVVVRPPPWMLNLITGSDVVLWDSRNFY